MTRKSWHRHYTDHGYLVVEKIVSPAGVAAHTKPFLRRETPKA